MLLLVLAAGTYCNLTSSKLQLLRHAWTSDLIILTLQASALGLVTLGTAEGGAWVEVYTMHLVCSEHFMKQKVK